MAGLSLHDLGILRQDFGGLVMAQATKSATALLIAYVASSSDFDDCVPLLG
jgi:hypothetical protein